MFAAWLQVSARNWPIKRGARISCLIQVFFVKCTVQKACNHCITVWIMIINNRDLRLGCILNWLVTRELWRITIHHDKHRHRVFIWSLLSGIEPNCFPFLYHLFHPSFLPLFLPQQRKSITRQAALDRVLVF